ncbi:MAG: filamentous hemagglutinin N-terminal domain-containing protein [Rhodocyclaceae bacterium]|nr:filamentous hemagglutinin N-terminal domain-containing protein [Rhodocyclaceae bacterium]
MNRVYRVVWNAAKSVWQAVCETGKAHGKQKSARSLRRATALAGIVFAGGALAAPASNELPTGGTVVSGSATITASDANMTILQTTQRTAIDWATFNIGSAAHVHFEQPSGGAALNRVLDTNASQIYGKLTSTGQVFLVNPNGVFFAPGAQVDVGGLVASTLAISNTDFMAGNYTFAGSSSNAIINQGNIKVGAGGTAALIAAKITNTGSIEAPQGNVLLGAGSKVTLDMGGPVKIQVEQGAIDALIEQGGAIKADGGLVYLSAKAAGDLVSTVINHTGITEAQTLATGESGQIYLMGGMDNERIVVGGTLDASASNGGNGGFIETSAAIVQIDPQVNVTTLSSQGNTGTWLIDPTNFTISAGAAAQTDSGIGADTLSTALNSNNVTIQTAGDGGGNGDITVGSAVTKSSGSVTTLTLAAHRNILVNAAISGSSGSSLNVVLAARAAGGATGNVQINASIKSFGGNITIGGGDATASGYAIASGSSNTGGVTVGSSAVVDATGDGSGTADATLPTVATGGNIAIRGKGNTTAIDSGNWGVQVQDGSIVSGGSGNISIEGHGGNGASLGTFWSVGSGGVVLEADAYVKTNTGSVTIKGYKGTGGDQYGIVSTESSKLIGTNGQLLFEGDTLAIRNGTLTIAAGQDSDIKVPIVGSNGEGGEAVYGFTKTGAGILNLWGDAQLWNDSPPTNTATSRTTGTFTDAASSVNIVSLTANQALFAFSTRPATVNSVATSSAAAIVGGGGGGGGSSSTTTTTTTTTTNTVPKDTAVSTAQGTATQPVINSLMTANVLSPSAPASTDLSGGLAFVEIGGPQGQGGGDTTNVQNMSAPPQDGLGRDPFGFMRVFVVNGGVNLPPLALGAPGQTNQNDANQ